MTTEVRPPPGTESGSLHWLIRGGQKKQFRWSMGGWQSPADIFFILPHQMPELGYRYLEPVVPPSGGAVRDAERPEP